MNFRNPSKLKRHTESKHKGVRYPCDQCDHAATTASGLRRQVESKHKGVRYPCNNCRMLYLLPVF